MLSVTEHLGAMFIVSRNTSSLCSLCHKTLLCHVHCVTKHLCYDRVTKHLGAVFVVSQSNATAWSLSQSSFNNYNLGWRPPLCAGPEIQKPWTQNIFNMPTNRNPPPPSPRTQTHNSGVSQRSGSKILSGSCCLWGLRRNDVHNHILPHLQRYGRVGINTVLSAHQLSQAVCNLSSIHSPICKLYFVDFSLSLSLWSQTISACAQLPSVAHPPFC